MRDCPECGGPVEARFHYCPWCSAPQRRKLVEFFRPHEELEGDQGKALRVSRYFGSSEPERHIRFSVWNETGSAEAAVSLDEEEAQRLARFILVHGPAQGFAAAPAGDRARASGRTPARVGQRAVRRKPPRVGAPGRRRPHRSSAR